MSIFIRIPSYRRNHRTATLHSMYCFERMPPSERHQNKTPQLISQGSLGEAAFGGRYGQGCGMGGVPGVPGMIVGGPGIPSGPGVPGITVGGVPGVPGV
jgi:hypothetical protein